MQTLIVSMMRFSAALTLWGMDQIQNTLKVAEGEEKLSNTLDGFEKALDSLTEVLVGRMDDKNKDTLKSVTKMSEEVVGRTADQLSMLNPREIIGVASDMLRKTSDATAEYVSKAAAAVEKATKNENPPEQQAAAV
jgi:hypothetical protein